MQSLLNKLGAQIDKHPRRAFFAPPASPEQIDGLQQYIQLPLPDSYRLFLRMHNGGFFSHERPDKADDIHMATEAWNSNQLLGVEEIADYFDRIRYKFSGRYIRFIPFCHTQGQELLVFSTIGETSDDSPVFDAWHEVGPDDWMNQKLYDGFAEFLEAYIEKFGDIRTIG